MMQAFLSWYNGLTDTLTGSLILFAVGLVLLIKEVLQIMDPMALP